MITKEQVNAIIQKLSERNVSTGIFDSHEFIDLYRAEFEHDYISMLVEHDKNEHNTAFQSTNSQIARFLSNNSKELNIEKIDSIDSTNDHGNKSSNAKWRILRLVIVMIGVFFSFDNICYAQDQFDMPTFRKKEIYIADTIYIKNDILLLQDFKNKGYSTKDSLYNQLKRLFYCRHRYSDYTPSSIKKDHIIKSAETWLELFQGVITHTRDSLEFTLDEITNNNRYLESVGYYSNNNLTEPFYNFTVKYPQGKIAYKCPLIKVAKKEPIAWNKLTNTEKRVFFDEDKINLTKDYEWVIKNNKPNTWPEEYSTRTTVHYPVEVTYFKYDDYPEYAVICSSSKYDNEWILNEWILYDTQGNLKRIHYIDDRMEDEIRITENLAYLNDYKANKYNVSSEDSLTKKYIEMILSGEMDKLKNEYLGEMLGMAFAGAVASQMTSNYQEKGEIRDKVLKESMKTSNVLLKSIDEAKMKKARAFVNQLKSDHYEEFNRGRCIRIDDKSFYFSLVDVNGKATRVFRIEYTQEKPFEYKKNINLVK